MADFGTWMEEQASRQDTDGAVRMFRDLADLTAQLHAVAKGYEQWEADMLLDGRVWREECGLPHLTQHLYDKLMLLQEKRTDALTACKEFMEKYGD